MLIRKTFFIIGKRIIQIMIYNEKYLLKEENYTNKTNPKKHIIICSSLNDDMNHVKGWGRRLNGNTKKTAAFSIDVAGVVYKHFEPKYESKFLKNKKLNSDSIIIILDNIGYLTKEVKKNMFITWLGDIYKHQESIHIKNWRGQKYWAPYSDEQLESLVILVRELADEFKIELTVPEHNTKLNTLNEYGVLYKSNLDKKYLDINPSWDYKKFKNKIEDER